MVLLKDWPISNICMNTSMLCRSGNNNKKNVCDNESFHSQAKIVVIASRFAFDRRFAARTLYLVPNAQF